MNLVFAEFLRKFVFVFFDDILIYSTTWNTHIQHLSLVLSIMQRHSLFVKLSKCSFGQIQIDYLGHVVSRMESSLMKPRYKQLNNGLYQLQ